MNNLTTSDATTGIANTQHVGAQSPTASNESWKAYVDMLKRKMASGAYMTPDEKRTLSLSGSGANFVVEEKPVQTKPVTDFQLMKPQV